MEGIIYLLGSLSLIGVAARMSQDKVKRKRKRPVLPSHEQDKHDRMNSKRRYDPALDSSF